MRNLNSLYFKKSSFCLFKNDSVPPKKSFGSKIFEAFAREFAVKFFNENKVVNGLLESLESYGESNDAQIASLKSELDKQTKWLRQIYLLRIEAELN